MSRLMARMAKITICVSRPIQYGLRNAGAAASRTAAGTSVRTPMTPAVLGAAIETGGLDREHEHHRRKQREVRQFRNERLAEIVDEPDDDAADERALEA